VRDGESAHDSTGLSRRQASYAIQAALALKLLQRTDGLLSLTDLGDQLLLSGWGNETSCSILRTAIESMPLFELFPDLLSPELDASELATQLQINPKTALSQTTARKRASAIAQWPKYLKPRLERAGALADVVVVVQLSDIHFVSNEAGNPILSRANLIASGLSAHLDMWNLAACVFAITGDIAQSALREEYAIATRFLNELHEAVSKALRCKVYHVMVPGNHDCGLSGATSVRGQLLSHLTLETLDDEIFEAINQAQSNYRAFGENVQSRELLPLFSSRATSIATLDVGGRIIRFDKCNTAWCSKLKEQQGSLMFPVAEFPPDLPEGDAVVAMLHHPLSWIENISARALRDQLSATADIVLTGHEHVPSRYTVVNEAGEQLEYSEGAVLQDRQDETLSGFNAILLDFRDSTQRSYKFELVNGRYDATVLPSRAFKRAAARHRNAFARSASFAEYLRDPGDAYAHPRKKAIELADIYVVPELKPTFMTGGTEKLEEASIALLLKEERLLILGQELTGKTALAKMLVAQLYDEGKTPVLVRGHEIGKLEALRAAKFSEQYDGAALERYLQLPREQKALVIDDVHRSPASTIRVARSAGYSGARLRLLRCSRG
jgi:predicted MPP superfamily phosphohydrolase